LGTVVSRIRLADGETVLGFLPDGKSIATWHESDPLAKANIPSSDVSKATIGVYDAATGEVVRRVKGIDGANIPCTDRNLARPVHDFRTCGLVLAIDRRDRDARCVAGLSLLDLRDGTWRKAARGQVDFAVVHDSKPWILFKEWMERTELGRRVVVHDCRTGSTLFERLPKEKEGPAGDPFFIPGTNLLVIPLKSKEELAELGLRGRLEIWTIDEKPSVRIVESNHVDLFAKYSPSAGGTIATWGGINGNDRRFTLFTIHEGTMTATYPPTVETSVWEQAPITDVGVSRRGRSALGGPPWVLWDIATGRRRWTATTMESPRVYALENRFAVFERWNVWLEQWVAKKDWMQKLETVAWRDLETGVLVQRVWTSEFRSPEKTNGDETLAVGPEGIVTGLPYRVNWVLVLLCQAVLAAPLVMLWMVGRWRRKRRVGAVRE